MAPGQNPDALRVLAQAGTKPRGPLGSGLGRNETPTPTGSWPSITGAKPRCPPGSGLGSKILTPSRSQPGVSWCTQPGGFALMHSRSRPGITGPKPQCPPGPIPVSPGGNHDALSVPAWAGAKPQHPPGSSPGKDQQRWQRRPFLAPSCAHHRVQRLWGPFHGRNVTEISRADLLVGRQDRHSFQGTGKMKALVNFQSLSFNTSGENFLIWKQTDQEILKGFSGSKATPLPWAAGGTRGSPRSQQFPRFRLKFARFPLVCVSSREESPPAACPQPRLNKLLGLEGSHCPTPAPGVREMESVPCRELA